MTTLRRLRSRVSGFACESTGLIVDICDRTDLGLPAYMAMFDFKSAQRYIARIKYPSPFAHYVEAVRHASINQPALLALPDRQLRFLYTIAAKIDELKTQMKDKHDFHIQALGEAGQILEDLLSHDDLSPAELESGAHDFEVVQDASKRFEDIERGGKSIICICLLIDA